MRPLPAGGSFSPFSPSSVSHLDFLAPSVSAHPPLYATAPVHPTPKPRSRTLDKFSQLEQLHKAKQASHDAPGRSHRYEDSDRHSTRHSLSQWSPDQEELCDVLGRISSGQEDSHGASGQLSPEQDSHNALEKTIISDSQGNRDGNSTCIVL